MEKYTAGSAKVHLNSETVRQIKCNFKFWKDTDQQKEEVFAIYVWMENFLSLNTKKTTFSTKEMNLILSLDTKTNLSFWTAKPEHCVKSIYVWSFFLFDFFLAFGLKIRTRPTLYANILHAVDARTLPLYFDTIMLKTYSYKLADWLWWNETSSFNSRCFVSLIPQKLFIHAYIYIYIYI